MTPGAVQLLQKGHVIVFPPEGVPVKLKRFAPQDYNEATTIPPPPRRVLKVDDSLVQSCLAAKDDSAWADVDELEAFAQLAGDELKKNPKEREERQKPDQSPGRPEKEQGKEQKKKDKGDKSFNDYGDRVPRV